MAASKQLAGRLVVQFDFLMPGDAAAQQVVDDANNFGTLMAFQTNEYLTDEPATTSPMQEIPFLDAHSALPDADWPKVQRTLGAVDESVQGAPHFHGRSRPRHGPSVEHGHGICRGRNRSTVKKMTTPRGVSH